MSPYPCSLRRQHPWPSLHDTCCALHSAAGCSPYGVRHVCVYLIQVLPYAIANLGIHLHNIRRRLRTPCKQQRQQASIFFPSTIPAQKHRLVDPRSLLGPLGPGGQPCAGLCRRQGTAHSLQSCRPCISCLCGAAKPYARCCYGPSRPSHIGMCLTVARSSAREHPPSRASRPAAGRACH